MAAMESEGTVVLCDARHHEIQLPIAPLRHHSQAVMARVRERYMPPAYERSALLASISQAEEEVLRLLPDITRLEDVVAAMATSLDKLKKHKEALDNHIAAQKSLLYSPIRALPAELLSLIFSFVSSSSEDRTTEDMQTLRRGMDRDALNISQTCMFWRNVSLSMPLLWTSISVNVDTTDIAACGALPVYLRHSHRKPLHVNIYHARPSNFPKEPKDTERTRSAISTSLIPQSNRFSTLKIFGCDPFFNETLGLFNLFTLGLYDLAPIQHWDEFIWLESIGSRCTLELVHHARSKGIQCLDEEFYDRIDELILREHTPFDALWILSEFSCIEHLDLEIEDGHCSSLKSTVLDMVSDLVLPKLESLYITSHTADTYGCVIEVEDPITQFLQKVTAPRLTSLRLDCDDGNTWSQSDFIQFLAQSKIQSQLETLHFIGPTLTEDELIETLAMLPGLVSLAVCEQKDPPIVTEKILSLLTFNPGGTNLLPSLEELSFTFEHLLDRPGLIVETIASRLNVHPTSSMAPLLEFNLDYRHQSIDPEVLFQLRRMQSGGLLGEIVDMCSRGNSSGCRICEDDSNDN
ncbi:hypothetical protein F5146DRAFT_1118309 [Armillaria mellea]|nr:hypothetical protein F5146DRAFT_1118309 [Armillaria mellea]